MNYMFFMKELYPFQHLIAYHQSTLQRHNLIPINEDIFNTSSQQLHQHDVEFALCCDSMNFWYASNVE